MKKFRWDEFQGTDKNTITPQEQDKDWKPAGMFHLWFFLVIVLSSIVVTVINDVYPGEIMSALSRYFGKF